MISISWSVSESAGRTVYIQGRPTSLTPAKLASPADLQPTFQGTSESERAGGVNYRPRTISRADEASLAPRNHAVRSP
jgi:hypothetical protein